MSKHTPGPWQVLGRSIMDAQKDPICDMNLPVNRADAKVQAANARLIASAPELLEALELLHTQHMQGQSTLFAWNRARAAIAKAKGEPA